MSMIYILLFMVASAGAASLLSIEEGFQQLRDRAIRSPIGNATIECRDDQLEIAFIIDTSRSIHIYDFKIQIQFIKDMVSIFNIGPDKVRVAAVSFGQIVIMDSAFGFTKYETKEQVLEGIENIHYRGRDLGEGTQTAMAISFIRKDIFKRARPGVNKIIMVLTDGMSTYPLKTVKEAFLAKKDGIQMIAVGIGPKVSMEELKAIASGNELVFEVNSFDLLQKFEKRIMMQTCKELYAVSNSADVPLNNQATTTALPNDQGCAGGPMDINFVFNPSQIESRRVIQFIDNSVTSKDLARDDVRVGIITAKVPNIVGFRLNRYKTKAEMKKHFDEYDVSLLAPLLLDLRTEGFHPTNGGRGKARKVGVVFLRSKLDDPLDTVVQAKYAHADGIDIYVVVVGNSVGKKMVSHIANNKTDHILSVKKTKDLSNLSVEFVQNLCKTK